MALTLNDLDFKVRFPELPRSMPLFKTEAPSQEKRGRAVEVLRKTFKLDDVRPVELPDSVVFAGKRGEVEYFHASGALWSLNTEADAMAENEFRKWSGLTESEDDNDIVLSLDPRASKRLLGQAKELLGEAELASDVMTSGRVVLDQVSELSEKGEILTRGAGSATAQFGYAMEGVPVLGAGAKSLIFAEPDPERGQPTMIGLFHAWRPVVGSTKLSMTPVEDALAVGLLQDPELGLYRERGHRIEITHLAFAYLALPATVRQTYLFPVFQVEGRVHNPDDEEEGDGFFFGRYHHAAGPDQYHKADVFADYLVRMN